MSCAILLPAEILNMDVSAQPGVISQVPAGVIGIVVNHDIVISPIPVIDVIVVIGCHAKIKSAEPETIPVPALNPVDMPGAEFAAEASMFPGMIEVVVRVVPAGVVSHLTICLRVHVRRFGMIRLIAKAATRVTWLPATVIAICR